jgi:hypothetical protein
MNPLALILTAALAQTQHAAKPRVAETPLPDVHELIARALATEKKTFAQRENYLCQLHAQQDELDSHGNLKKQHSEDSEEFFVNGHQIDRTIAKQGQPLNAGDAKKEDERINKDVKKYSDPSQRVKQEGEEQKRVESVLKMMEFTNERRAATGGRPTIEFDITGNMAAQPDDLDDRFVQAMQGTLQLDEATGSLVDLNIRSVKDVKIAGGLVASLHKGFWLHLHQSQHADGVWLPDLAEGSGDARAALFLHPYFRFHQTEGDCRLYSVSTTQADKGIAEAPKK